jgi:restriction endonuclease S subunit
LSKGSNGSIISQNILKIEEGLNRDLEISVLRLGEVLEDNNGKRMDSEYFKKDILNYEKKLTNYKSLEELGTFLIGPFGSTVTKDNYVGNTDNYYIRGLDIGDFFLKKPEAKISPEQFYKLKHFHIKYEDIFITVVGTIGKVSIITNKNIKAIFSCKSTIFRSNINPYYVTTFFNTKLGYKLLTRGKRGAIQEGLNLTDLKAIKIPIFSNKFQLEIEQLVKSAHKKLEDSKTLYKKTENLLLEELDLLDFKSTKESISIKSFSESFGSSGRLDSEYYLPKYDEVIKRVKLKKFDRLKNIVDIKKSIETGSEAYSDNGVEYIRVSNLTKFGLSQSSIYIPYDFFDKEQLKELKPKKDTILLSKDGTVGIAYSIKNETNIITSGAILHLNIKDNIVLPEYLTLILNSRIVQMQSQRDAGGSIIKHWKPSEIKEVLIPIIDYTLQTQIESKIKESFRLKEESKRLLELAKRSVEVAIEEGEEIALKFIEKEKI